MEHPEFITFSYYCVACNCAIKPPQNQYSHAQTQTHNENVEIYTRALYTIFSELVNDSPTVFEAIHAFICLCLDVSISADKCAAIASEILNSEDFTTYIKRSYARRSFIT